MSDSARLLLKNTTHLIQVKKPDNKFRDSDILGFLSVALADKKMDLGERRISTTRAESEGPSRVTKSRSDSSARLRVPGARWPLST